MKSVRTSNRLPIPILTYHHIDMAPDKGVAFRGLYVSPSAFSRQMMLLRLMGYRGLAMTALMPYLRGERTGKVVGITFDDGYLNNLTYALPVLQRHGFSSTCYVVSQQVGKDNEWDLPYGVSKAPLMDPSNLRLWVTGGQEVGAHTRHHVRLTKVDGATALEEIALCKTELESMTGSPVQHFCYPYGEYTEAHVAMARKTGFDSVTTTQRSRCHAGEDLMLLPRVPVLRTTVLPVFAFKLKSDYEDRRRQ